MENILIAHAKWGIPSFFLMFFFCGIIPFSPGILENSERLGLTSVPPCATQPRLMNHRGSNKKLLALWPGPSGRSGRSGRSFARTGQKLQKTETWRLLNVESRSTVYFHIFSTILLAHMLPNLPTTFIMWSQLDSYTDGPHPRPPLPVNHPDLEDVELPILGPSWVSRGLGWTLGHLTLNRIHGVGMLFTYCWIIWWLVWGKWLWDVMANVSQK